MGLPCKPLIALGLALVVTPALADHPSLSINNGSSAAIVGLSAQVLPKDVLSLSFKHEYLKNDSLPKDKLAHLEGQDVHSVDYMSVDALSLAWGQTEKLTLGFSLPFISRNNVFQAPHHHDEDDHEDEAGAESLGDASGWGDLTIYSQYQFYQSTDGLRLASVYTGLKLPTGKTNRKNNNGESYEAEHQPGSGSFDGLIGVAASQRWTLWTLEGSLLATLASEGTQHTDLGNALNYDVSLSRPLLPGHQHEHGHHSGEHHSPGYGLLSTTSLVVELNGEWRDKVDIHGSDDNNTGGNLIYATLGLRTALPNHWSVALAAGIPVLENLNGIQAEPDWRVSLNLGKAIRF
ncbi:MAG: hypothetical protein R3E57_02325 [Porticoccaceae bacterium]